LSSDNAVYKWLDRAIAVAPNIRSCVVPNYRPGLRQAASVADMRARLASRETGCLLYGKIGGGWPSLSRGTLIQSDLARLCAEPTLDRNSIFMGDVRLWPEADVVWAPTGVRFQGKSGHGAD
jgi:hypothetical protein